MVDPKLLPPIPPTLADVFSAMDDRAFVAFMARQLGPGAVPILPPGNKVDRDGAIGLFLAGVLDRLGQPHGFLPKDEAKLLRRIVREGSVLRRDGRDIPGGKAERALIDLGFVFPFRHGDKMTVTVPLEIALAVPFDLGDPPVSLLMAMGRYPFDVVRSLASRLGLSHTGRLTKIRLSAIVCQAMLRGYEERVASLTPLERSLLRAAFMNGGTLANTLLNRQAEKESRPQPQTFHSWYSGDPVLGRLTGRLRDDQGGLADLHRALLALLAGGLLAFPYERDSYDSIFHYFIPVEAFPIVAAIFFGEMDAKRQEAEAKMAAPEPDVFSSYGGRVLDDLVLVQIAAVCGKVETVKNGDQFKQRSISAVARLLKVEETYVEKLLTLLDNHRLSALKQVDYHPRGFLREQLLHPHQPGTVLLPLLKPIQGWVWAEELKPCLMNHRPVYPFISSLQGHGLTRLFAAYSLLGVFDFSPDLKRLKVNVPMMNILFGRDESLPSAPLKTGDKPLVVQPNLEMLLPFHVDTGILRKLGEIATLTVLDRMLHFTLSKESLLRAVDRGWDAEKIKVYLASLSSNPLPQAVGRFIETMGEKKGEATLLPCCAVIRCRGLGLKEKILSLTGLDAYPLKGAEDYVCITAPYPPQALRMLKNKGIFAELATLEEHEDLEDEPDERPTP